MPRDLEREVTSVEPSYHHEGRPVVFAADIHLDREQSTIDCFRALCAGTAREAEALYLLGDIFDLWIGDDDPEPAYVPVVDALAELSGSGVSVRFIAGNRDFLLGDEFCGRTGVQRLDDHTLIDLFGTRTLLCHGDSLCTDDQEFQRFREQLRSDQWQQEFLAKPLAERRKIAADLRDGSRDATASKANALTDVSAQAVQDTLRKYQARQLIHGHTHRPAHHEHTIDGHTVNRYVLSDWQQQPSMLVATATGLRVETVGG